MVPPMSPATGAYLVTGATQITASTAFSVQCRIALLDVFPA
jgi:hypothetical protein